VRRDGPESLAVGVCSWSAGATHRGLARVYLEEARAGEACDEVVEIGEVDGRIGSAVRVTSSDSQRAHRCGGRGGRARRYARARTGSAWSPADPGAGGGASRLRSRYGCRRRGVGRDRPGSRTHGVPAPHCGCWLIGKPGEVARLNQRALCGRDGRERNLEQVRSRPGAGCPGGGCAVDPGHGEVLADGPADWVAGVGQLAPGVLGPTGTALDGLRGAFPSAWRSPTRPRGHLPIGTASLGTPTSDALTGPPVPARAACPRERRQAAADVQLVVGGVVDGVEQQGSAATARSAARACAPRPSAPRRGRAPHPGPEPLVGRASRSASGSRSYGMCARAAVARSRRDSPVMRITAGDARAVHPLLERRPRPGVGRRFSASDSTPSIASSPPSERVEQRDRVRTRQRGGVEPRIRHSARAYGRPRPQP